MKNARDDELSASQLRSRQGISSNSRGEWDGQRSNLAVFFFSVFFPARYFLLSPSWLVCQSQ
jgi:hypothetical protein